MTPRDGLRSGAFAGRSVRFPEQFQSESDLGMGREDLDEEEPNSIRPGVGMMPDRLLAGYLM